MAAPASGCGLAAALRRLLGCGRGPDVQPHQAAPSSGPAAGGTLSAGGATNEDGTARAVLQDSPLRCSVPSTSAHQLPPRTSVCVDVRQVLAPSSAPTSTHPAVQPPSRRCVVTAPLELLVPSGLQAQLASWTASYVRRSAAAGESSGSARLPTPSSGSLFVGGRAASAAVTVVSLGGRQRAPSTSSRADPRDSGTSAAAAAAAAALREVGLPTSSAGDSTGTALTLAHVGVPAAAAESSSLSGGVSAAAAAAAPPLAGGLPALKPLAAAREVSVTLGEDWAKAEGASPQQRAGYATPTLARLQDFCEAGSAAAVEPVAESVGPVEFMMAAEPQQQQQPQQLQQLQHLHEPRRLQLRQAPAPQQQQVLQQWLLQLQLHRRATASLDLQRQQQQQRQDPAVPAEHEGLPRAAVSLQQPRGLAAAHLNLLGPSPAGGGFGCSLSPASNASAASAHQRIMCVAALTGSARRMLGATLPHAERLSLDAAEAATSEWLSMRHSATFTSFPTAASYEEQRLSSSALDTLATFRSMQLDPAALTQVTLPCTGLVGSASAEDVAALAPPLDPLAMGSHIVLQRKLGSGAHGAVYQGLWHGCPAAVKLAPARPAQGLSGALTEMLLARALAHPNVVQTYSCKLWQVTPAALALCEALAASTPAAEAPGPGPPGAAASRAAPGAPPAAAGGAAARVAGGSAASSASPSLSLAHPSLIALHGSDALASHMRPALELLEQGPCNTQVLIGAGSGSLPPPNLEAILGQLSLPGGAAVPAAEAAAATLPAAPLESANSCTMQTLMTGLHTVGSGATTTATNALEPCWSARAAQQPLPHAFSLGSSAGMQVRTLPSPVRSTPAAALAAAAAAGGTATAVASSSSAAAAVASALQPGQLCRVGGSSGVLGRPSGASPTAAGGPTRPCSDALWSAPALQPAAHLHLHLPLGAGAPAPFPYARPLAPGGEALVPAPAATGDAGRHVSAECAAAGAAGRAVAGVVRLLGSSQQDQEQGGMQVQVQGTTCRTLSSCWRAGGAATATATGTGSTAATTLSSLEHLLPADPLAAQQQGNGCASIAKAVSELMFGDRQLSVLIQLVMEECDMGSLQHLLNRARMRWRAAAQVNPGHGQPPPRRTHAVTPGPAAPAARPPRAAEMTSPFSTASVPCAATPNPKGPLHEGQGRREEEEWEQEPVSPPSLRGGGAPPPLYLPFLNGGRWTPSQALRALLLTARELALGMAYLHAQSVVHGDLKPSNVLLRSSRADLRGWVAKLADFGLSTVLHSAAQAPAAAAVGPHTPVAAGEAEEEQQQGGGRAALGPAAQAAGEAQRPPPRLHGTLAYLAPEAVDGRPLDRPADVYSFGVVLWQLVTGCTPYEGWLPAQIVAALNSTDEHGVATQLGICPLEWPSGGLPALTQLGRACMALEPLRRPTFAQVARALQEMIAELPPLQQQHQQQGAGAAAGSNGVAAG